MTTQTHMSGLVAALGTLAIAAMAHAADRPMQHFLYTSAGELPGLAALVDRPEIRGVQVIYHWKSLETAKGKYDFSDIEADLAFVKRRHKQLFIQIQDRFFDRKHRHVPTYLLVDPVYGGGLAAQRDYAGEGQPEGVGWVAMQWNPAVRERFQRLLAALAKRFDGRVFGINLPESAADIDLEHDQTGFTCDGYFEATLANVGFARKAFRKSHVVQYMNFWPCEWNDDHRFMSRGFAFAEANGIGLGGPDIVPDRKAQLKNSYPFFHRYKGRLALVAMAVQEPTLTYINPKTRHPFTRDEFESYARDFLGVNVLFWSAETLWLKRGR